VLIIIRYCFFILLLSHFTNAFSLDCPEGTYVVSEHPRQEYYRSNGTSVSATNVSTYCKKYRTEQPLVPQFEKKMPKGWPHKKELFKKCSNKDEQYILKTLQSIPKNLSQIGKLKVLCATQSEIENNPATSAPSEKIIVLYDSAMKSDTKRILTHELAHIYYDGLSGAERDSYWRAAEWKKKEGQPPYTNRVSFTAADGAFDPEEDFANNIEFFFAEPNHLKNNFSKIYDWIMKNLGGNK